VNPNIDYTFFRDAWTSEFIGEPPELPSTGGASEGTSDPRIPHDRIMEAIGSIRNEDPLSFQNNVLNQRVFQVRICPEDW